MIELILEALNLKSHCYTNGVSFDNNDLIEPGCYKTNDLLQEIRNNGGNVQETTIWVTNENPVPLTIPHSYGEFYRSGFCAVIDVYDFDHFDVYAKEQASIESMKEMIAAQSPTTQIHSVTDENDNRTGF